jgi:hypothetical protein
MRSNRLGANSRPSKRGRKPRGTGRRTVAIVPFSPIGDQIVKRMTLPLQNITTSAGGIVTVNFISSTSVQSAPASEWASFSARYQQYRVRGMKFILDPCFPVNTGLTAVTGHSQLYFADFIGTAAAGSAAAVISDERMISFTSSKRIAFSADWARNPNAKLWNPTSAAIPGANTFSIVYCSSTTATMAVSQIYLVGVIEFIVEFRGSQ